jgi:hypothetical protein
MKEQKTSSAIVTSLLENLIDLIEKGNAHASLDNALNSIPFSLLGEKTGESSLQYMAGSRAYSHSAVGYS